jgi:hypothetical protein
MRCGKSNGTSSSRSLIKGVVCKWWSSPDASPLPRRRPAGLGHPATDFGLSRSSRNKAKGVSFGTLLVSTHSSIRNKPNDWDGNGLASSMYRQSVALTTHSMEECAAYWRRTMSLLNSLHDLAALPVIVPATSLTKFVFIMGSLHSGTRFDAPEGVQVERWNITGS